MYTVSQFAKRVGVVVKTLQRWDRQGILKARRTLTNTTVGVRVLQQPVAAYNDTLEQRPDGDAERKTRQGSERV